MPFWGWAGKGVVAVRPAVVCQAAGERRRRTASPVDFCWRRARARARSLDQLAVITWRGGVGQRAAFCYAPLVVYNLSTLGVAHNRLRLQ